MIITILVFLLPFIPPSCGHKKEEVVTSEFPVIDTSIVSDINKYSEFAKTEVTDSSTLKPDNTTKKSNDATKPSKFTFVERIFLYPDEENLSGFGYIYILFDKEYFCFFFSFLFLWIVLFNHLLNFKIFVLDNVTILLIGLIFLGILGIVDFDKLKFGFWITLGLYLITTLTFYLQLKLKSRT